MKRTLIDKRALFVLAGLLTAGAGLASPMDPVGKKVALGDIRRYSILLPAAAHTTETYAAGILAKGLAGLTGFAPPIVAEKAGGERPTGRCLSVGRTRLAAAAGFATPTREQGYRLAAKDGNFFFLGERGPLYAVLAALEEDWRVRWYAKCDAGPVFPPTKPDALALVPREYAPEFVIREPLHYTMMGGDWMALNRIQPRSYFCGCSPGQGGRIGSARYFVHTYDAFLPSKKYFRDHPEYYPMRGGKRIPSTQNDGQLCYSSEGAAEEIARLIVADAAEHPEYRVWTLSPNDNLNMGCECPSCARLIREEGLSGAEIFLSNRIARRVREKVPYAKFSISAYNTTQAPPRTIRAEPGIAVDYAPICQRAGNLVYRPWTEIPQIMREFSAWRDLGVELWVWDYEFVPVGPLPNFEVTRANIGYWRGCGVKCAFLERYEWGQGSFAELRSWLFAKMFYNPDWDMWGLIDDFMRGWYGAAAADMRRYLDAQMAVWYRFRAGGNREFRFLPEDVAAMRAALRAALRTAEGDETLRRRVALECVPFLSLTLKGCRKSNVDQYRRDLAFIKELTARYQIPIDSIQFVTERKMTAAEINRPVFARWDRKLGIVEGSGGFETYCDGSIILTEKNCFPPSRHERSAEAVSGAWGGVRGKENWLIQFNFPDFIAAADNQSTYVVRARVKAEIRGRHRPTDRALGLNINFHGAKSCPGAHVTFADLPKDGWGWVYFYRMLAYSPSGEGYFYTVCGDLSPEDLVKVDYLEFIPLDRFRDAKFAASLPHVVF